VESRAAPVKNGVDLNLTHWPQKGAKMTEDEKDFEKFKKEIYEEMSTHIQTKMGLHVFLDGVHFGWIKGRQTLRKKEEKNG